MLVGLSENLLLVDLDNPTNYNVGMISGTDLAYAAGYIDGDGCFSINRIKGAERVRDTCSVIINSTELENLEWFQSKFSGNIYPQKEIDPTHKPLYRYELKGDNLDWLLDIARFLIEKREECLLFAEFFRSKSRIDREIYLIRMKELKESYLIPVSIKEPLEKLRNTISPSNYDFAYLAGFIDAECCLGIQKNPPANGSNPTYKIQLQCNNSKSPCFKWLVERFGGQLHFINRSKYLNNRNQMTWRLSSAALYPILKMIRPFLIHKQPVCDELIKLHETKVPLKGCISRNSPNFSEFYQPILNEREHIFLKVKQLNKKGI